MSLDPALQRSSPWREPPALAQLLGLCPLLAVTTSVVRALALAVVTSLVLLASCLIVSALRRLYARELRLIMHMLVIASLVSVVDFVMSAYCAALHAQLGVFVPLIATNCVILSRAESFAASATLGRAARDALGHATVLTLTFLLFGALRELFGHGTLLAGVDALRGGDGDAPGLTLFHGGFLLVTLAPGAFLALALISALHRALASRTEAVPAPDPAAARG